MQVLNAPGIPFYPPGASLFAYGPATPTFNTTPDSFSSTSNTSPLIFESGYGYLEYLADHWTDDSEVRKRLAATANDAGRWARLDPQECFLEYRACKSRSEYGDVLIIICPEKNQMGWERCEVFHFDPISNLSDLYDPHILPDAVNPLWFSTLCHTTGSNDHVFICGNSCLKALGLEQDDPFSSENVPSDDNGTLTFGYRMGMHNEAVKDLNVEYCLAMPLDIACKLGLSNILLLVINYLLHRRQGHSNGSCDLEVTSSTTGYCGRRNRIFYPKPRPQDKRFGNSGYN